jgi:predicted aspartyl protease
VSVIEQHSDLVASMASIRGSLDSDHTPVVTIAIASASGPSTFVDAVIDTGFTGLVQVPAPLAAAAGLTPRTATEIQYPDGRIDTIPLAWGRITLGAEAREGFVHIQRGSDEAIVGVEFLRLFRKTLILSVSDGTVLLIDSLADLTPE